MYNVYIYIYIYIYIYYITYIYIYIHIHIYIYITVIGGHTTSPLWGLLSQGYLPISHWDYHPIIQVWDYLGVATGYAKK